MSGNKDIVVGIRLTADGDQLVGEVKLSKREMDQFASSVDQAGRKAADFSRKTSEGFRQVRQNILLASAAGTAAITSLGGVLKIVADTGAEFEQYNLRLRHVLGSVEEGNRLFDDMVKFAGRVPFSFSEIMASATQLAGVVKGGAQEVNSLMPMIADLAAVSGLGIQQTTEQVVRMMSAGAASADLFRERGILAMLGFQAGVSYSAEETRTKLISAWEDAGSKFRGTALEMASTWDGITSMLGDKWTLFKKEVGDQGLFNFIKAFARTINDDLGGSIKDQKDLAKKLSDEIISFTENTALGLASVADQMRAPMATASSAINKMWDGYQKLPGWVQEIGVIGAIVGGRKGMVLLGAVSALSDDISVTARWWAAYSSGQIGFAEWFTTGTEGARTKLAELDKSLAGVANTAADVGHGNALIDGSPAGDSSRARVQEFFNRLKKNMADLATAPTPDGPSVPTPGGPAQPDTQGPSQDLLDQAKALTEQIGSAFQTMEDRVANSYVSMYEKLVAAGGEGSAQLQALTTAYNDWLDANAAEQADKETLRRNEQLQAKITQMDESFLTEAERETQAYENRRQMLEEALNNKLITEQRYRELSQKLESQHQQKMSDIEKRSMSYQERLWASGWTGKADVMGQVLGQMATLMQSGSRKMFEVGKAAAIAETIVTTYSSAQKAFDALAGIPVVGPALGAAAAAAAIAGGVMRVQKIASTQFGSKGSVSAGGASFPTTGGGGNVTTTAAGAGSYASAPTPQPQKTEVKYVFVNGVTTQEVVDMATNNTLDVLPEHVNNADYTFIDPLSAQGRLLAANG